MSHDRQWDPSAVQRLERIGGPKLALEILQFFTSTTPERIATICQGADSGDHDQVERTAHALRSSAGNVGAREIAVRAGRIENSAANRADSSESLPESARQLQACWADLEAHVDAVQKRLSEEIRQDL